MADNPLPRPHDVIPSPDPSVVTDHRIEELGVQLRREREYAIQALEARLDGMDKAMILFSDNLTRVPTETDKQVGHLKELHDEKFDSIQRQFIERDVRTDQAAIATKIAVDAALQAQKEAAGAQNESNAAAISKSEVATVKQIDSIVALLNSNSNAINDKIAVLNGRLDRGEGLDRGVRETRTDAHMTSGQMIAAIVAGFVGLGLVLSVIEFALKAH